jgi:glycosyltransferase involved in cell wall biosynthesis
MLAQKYVNKVVVCDDGSTDMTADIAEKVGADVAKHEDNMGYGVALQTLFRKVRELDADAMVTLDGDGQHNPDEIPLLVEPVLEGKADVVIGSRFLGDSEKNNVPRHRRFGIKIITKLTDAASNSALSDAQSGFRAYGRKALQSLNLNENGMGVSVEVLMEAKKHGLRVVELPTGCNYRGLDRTSTRDPVRHGMSVVSSIVRLVVEEKPLFFLGIPGATFLSVGALFGLWMLQLWTTEHRIVTNVALASITFTMVGLFSIFTSITLYAIGRLAQRTNKH